MKINSHCLGDPENQQSGMISILTMIVSVLLIGALSFSVYVGQQVEKKIEVQNATDVSTLAMGHHAAQGLNMISANNLTIGAALHVAASVPILASYASIAYAFTSDIKDAGTDFVKMGLTLLSVGFLRWLDRYQENIWNRLAPVHGAYMQVAAGTTAFNEFLAAYWFLPTPVRSIEVMRANIGGSIVVPLQDELLHRVLREGQAPLMTLAGVSTTKADEAMCYTLRASKTAEMEQKLKDDYLGWLVGPILSFGGTPGKVADGAAKLSQFITKYSPMIITFTGCGYGLRSSILWFWKKLSESINNGVLSFPQGLLSNIDSFQELFNVLDAERVSGSPSWRDDERGYFDIPTLPGCSRSFQAIAKAHAAAMVAVNFKEIQEDFIYRKFLQQIKENVSEYPSKPDPDQYKTPSEYQAAFNSWEKNRSPYICEVLDDEGNLTETIYDAIPHVMRDGTRVCIEIRGPYFDPACAMKQYAGMDAYLKKTESVSRCFSRIGDKIESWRDDTCRYFDVDKDKPNDQDLELISYKRQMKSYSGELSLVKSSRFSEKKGDGNGRERTIGYTYVSDEEAFRRSLRFVGLGASPSRLRHEIGEKSCPESFQIDFEGEKRCSLTPLSEISRWQHLADPRSMEDAYSAGLVELMAEHKGKLASSWDRSMWASASVEVVKKGDVSQVQHLLFWPNWYPRIMPRGSVELMSDVFDFILKDNERGSEEKAKIWDLSQ